MLACLRRHQPTKCVPGIPPLYPTRAVSALRKLTAMPAPSAGFVNVRSWLQDVREHADPHLTCILVGNKIDLCADDAGPGLKRQREVTTEEAELWAQEEGMLFVEASARSGENVEEAFERATRDILGKVHRGVFDDDRVRVCARACVFVRCVVAFSPFALAVCCGHCAACVRRPQRAYLACQCVIVPYRPSFCDLRDSLSGV